MRITILLMLALLTGTASASPRFPGNQWTEASPASVGLDAALLREAADYLGGRGCIVRHGQMVFQWGDASGRGDVASAAKPWYTTFLWLAVEEGLLKSVDTPVAEYAPALHPLNPDLQHKDRSITFAHMGNQVSCYGVSERPGTAYDYNDWQMALFIDTLFHELYGATWEALDQDVLHARLTDILHCEDNPTFLAFGAKDRPGRLGVSPRDFARLGWLYINGGNWNGTQLLPTEVVRRAVGSPLPNRIPRTAGVAAAMVEGQRTLGSRDIPDNQTDHYGSYSWAWWVNGTDREGNRFWPDAPLDVFTALGHENGQRGMAVIPSLDVVIAWNDTTLGNRPNMPHPLNEVFRLIMAAAEDTPMVGQVIVNPANPAWLARKTGDGSTPLLLCGPGDPEGFLYRGERLADGKRNGDQAAIIEKIRGTGANALYIQAVRSHGGDGDATHNPFVDSDPAEGIDENILQQWEDWFRSMDDAGIVIYLFLYDDSASIWDTGDLVGDAERAFLETLVNRFEHHLNLVWCIAEEYQERFSPARIRAIAEVVRAADEHDHVIAVHKLDGLDFSEFADDPNIDQFAIQYSQPDADALHAGLVSCWENAAGRYNLNLSEAADHGFGREARRKNWAAALAGAHSMPLGWLFDDEGAPSRADLEGCGHLVRFFETSATPRMAPRDELAAEGTIYLLATPGESYLAYGADAGTPLGLRDVPRARYALTWCDPSTGAWVKQGAQTLEGDVTLPAPDGFLEDAALRLCRVGEAAPASTDLGPCETTMWAPLVEWRMVWAWVQHNGWWRRGQRPSLARRSIGDPDGDVRPNRTENLDQLTDNMLRYGYPGFEHNYGLWFDRRRDAHDTAHRRDANVASPFLEQPWARSEEGRAADGLPKYDLTRFNPWYFDRLAEFAGHCDRKGTVLFHKYHMQHNLLETPAHYVDFPWRPFNCVQDTGLPDGLPAANTFYDMTSPVRRDLQRRYIHHCLNALGDYRNVVHLAAQEYTGPLPFVQFWMDTIAEWEAENDKDVCIGLGAPKDVQDAILVDPVRGPRVDVIDLRYWWYRARWFDPATGEVTSAADTPVPGGDGRRFTCPGEGDRALLLERTPA